MKEKEKTQHKGKKANVAKSNVCLTISKRKQSHLALRDDVFVVHATELSIRGLNPGHSVCKNIISTTIWNQVVSFKKILF